MAITSCSGAWLPEFDSTLEIQAPEQGGTILLFLTAWTVFPHVHSGQLAHTPCPGAGISSVPSNLGNRAGDSHI